MWHASASAYKEHDGYGNYAAGPPLDYDSYEEDGAAGAAGGGHTYGGIRQLEQTSATSARDMVTMMTNNNQNNSNGNSNNGGTNPYTTLHHVNRELMELGLPSPLHLPEVPECLEDNQRVIDCLVELLRQRGKDLGFREQMDEELRKAMGEEDLLRNTIARLERELDGAQREAAGNKIRWQESDRVGGEIDAQRKKLAAELRTTRSNAAMVKAQFVHEAKKHEQIDGKLKERLQKLIVDKHRSSKLSVQLVNPVARDRSGRPIDTQPSSRDRRLLEELIGRYEANETELVGKVDALETMLRELAAALAALYADSAAAASGGDAALSDEPAVGDPAAALALIEAIGQRMRQDRAQKPAPLVDPTEITRRDEEILRLRNETAELVREISDQRQVMEEQKKVMDMMVSNKEFSATSGRVVEPMDVLEASFSEMSMEQLEMEREALRKEKLQLEEERKRFTDAAIELGNERSELKRERQEFENNKVVRGTTDLLAGLPETPQWMRAVDTSQATPMILSQLQSMYNGTPTNAMLASMAAASAAFTAAMGSPGSSATPQGASSSVGEKNQQQKQQQRSPDEDFPEITPAEEEENEEEADSNNDVYGNDAMRRRGARAGATPRKTPVRTPADIRSSRHARTCTRPGCAAHAPHSHDDGSGNASAVMELKPPVPRFRRRAPDSTTDSDLAASSTLPARSRQPTVSGAAASASTRHAPYPRNATAASSSSSGLLAGAGTGASRSLARSSSSMGTPTAAQTSSSTNGRRGTAAPDIFR
ncbi:hypothetical protein IWW48_000797 [Coemansia sp. RSA 1200]|nr:hypothetical protein IWW48_000797 [Coemansia sp. RSA 1200]